MNWQIRPAGPGDLERLAELLAELFTIEVDFNIDLERQKRGLQMLLAEPLARVLVAEGGGLAVGLVTGQLTISTAEGGPALLVEDLVVAPAWRGLGIGRTLLDELGRWSASCGAHRLQLLADRNNSVGLDFYHHLGWRSTALICLRNRTA